MSDHDGPPVFSGWLTGLRQLPSPNYNQRPDGTPVDMLVIHNISLPPGEFGGDHVDALFCNTLDCSAHPFFEQLRGVTVSAHFLVNRAGIVTQYVPVTARAWHAGASHWQGRNNCNDFSVGIELEGTDTQPYTDSQYSSLVALIRQLMDCCPAVTVERIVGHSDIAPDRKTDPGPAFDWQRLRSSLQQQL